jgi:hypothetical protein
MSHILLALVASFLFVGATGILLGVWTAHHKKLDRLSNFSPVQLVEKIPTLPPVDARPQKPGPKPPERQWPGHPEEYEVVLYRDPSFRVIEDRVRVEDLGDITPLVEMTKVQGHSGLLLRHGREVARWKGHED